jgi:hypothetical protein
LPDPEAPVDPSYGVGIEHPDQGLPAPPPGIWPPPTPAHPIVPVPPGGSKPPPGTIWPAPGHPAHPIAPPSPGQPSHPIASNTYWMLVYTPGYGWKYVVVDPSLHVDASPPAPQPGPEPRRS